MQCRHAALIALILFSGCRMGSTGNTGEEIEHSPLPDISGARAATIALVQMVRTGYESHQGARPTAALGLFATIFLTQQAIIDTASAQQGIEAQQRILQGQQATQDSETFAILKELASILQVDIADMLNRSTSREQALQQYTRSLSNILQLSERKVQELSTLQEGLEEEVKEKKKIVRDQEKEIEKALDEERYEEASSKQEELAKASAELAEVEIKEEQAATIIEPFERLMEIGTKRLTAIEKNSSVLVAGLKVIDVPGIEDLGILEQEGLFERFSGSRREDTSAQEGRLGTVPDVLSGTGPDLS